MYSIIYVSQETMGFTPGVLTHLAQLGIFDLLGIKTKTFRVAFSNSSTLKTKCAGKSWRQESLYPLAGRGRVMSHWFFLDVLPKPLPLSVQEAWTKGDKDVGFGSAVRVDQKLSKSQKPGCSVQSKCLRSASNPWKAGWSYTDRNQLFWDGLSD